jgi:hypothetical protein
MKAEGGGGRLKDEGGRLSGSFSLQLISAYAVLLLFEPKLSDFLRRNVPRS